MAQQQQLLVQQQQQLSLADLEHTSALQQQQLLAAEGQQQLLKRQESQQQKELDAIMPTEVTELDAKSVTLSLHFVMTDTDRRPLPETNRNEITNTLIQRLSSVVVDENNNVKGAFQLSFRKPRPDEPNFIKVYGIPHVRLPIDHYRR